MRTILEELLLELYSSRQSTKANDIHVASTGFTTLLADNMRAYLVFGPPSSHLNLALLW